jgi:ribosomal protein S18 acetylase RimI-like enzyme
MSISTPAIGIRPVAPADEWAVRELFGALHAFNAQLDARFALAPGWEAILHEHLAHVRQTGHGLSLLAWENARPVGLALWGAHSDSPLFRHRHWAELLALYVAPTARGSGLAERLIGVGLHWAQTHGYERVQLYVTAANEAAKRCYTRAGFRPVQEVWRRELGAAQGSPPTDDECAAIYAQGHELLSTTSHYLVADEGCGVAREEERHAGD